MNFTSLAKWKRSDFLQKERKINLPSQTGFPICPPAMVHALSTIVNSAIRMGTILPSAASLGKCNA
jgi:hypothetical protein